MKLIHMKRLIGAALILALGVTLVCVIFDFEIAEYADAGDMDADAILEEFESNSPEHIRDVSLIGVQYVTGGTAWRVEKSSEGYENTDTILLSLFDLRCLKANSDFSIDMRAGFITYNLASVSAAPNDRLKALIPLKTYVYDKSSDGVIDRGFTVRDLNFLGIAKIFLRSFALIFIFGAIVLLLYKLIRRISFKHIRPSFEPECIEE